MHVSEDFYIRCNKCGSIIQIKTDDLEYKTASYDRPMGEEIEYNFWGEICCDMCHSWISFTITGFEYPAGAFEFSRCYCDKGEFVKEPSVEIDYEFDDDYYDYAYGEYIKAESLLEYNRERIENMSPRDFELFVGGLFEKLGFNVKMTPATRDGGCDIIATKSKPIPFTLIVECKHRKEKHKVDVSVVRSVYGVQTANQINQSVIVTSSQFTKDARKFAEERQTMMALWDIDDLLRFITENYD